MSVEIWMGRESAIAGIQIQEGASLNQEVHPNDPSTPTSLLADRGPEKEKTRTL
jgi:hypothetical protein